MNKTDHDGKMPDAAARGGMPSTVIRTDRITKVYKRFKHPSQRVKEAFHPFGKRYHEPFTALRELSVTVRKGESLGIIGRNGSGKSTLLQLVCGILTPTSGTIEVNGRVSALLELGAGFNPEFSGAENIYLNASILGLTRGETQKKYQRILDFADIGDFIDQPVKTYSSGMYVRLAFAIAVHVDPEILIIDEALSVGDIFFRQKCIQHMQNYMQGCTKLVVTHDMQTVANMCQRVIVLDRGNKIFEGSPLKGIEYYTRIMHNEIFAAGNGGDARAREADGDVTDAGEDGWVVVGREFTGGAGEVVIEKVKITSPESKRVRVVRRGDRLIMHLMVHAGKPKKNIIFGYTIKDRVGNAIFGQNTCDASTGVVDIDSGHHHVKLAITWPEIAPGDYTVTFGVGEGTHPLRHTVQSWAQNMIALSAISPDQAIHGIFNNPITELELKPQ